jgi:hypothetical protein
MLPEWWNDPDARQIVLIILATGAIAFLLLAYLFAFYGWS